MNKKLKVALIVVGATAIVAITVSLVVLLLHNSNEVVSPSSLYAESTEDDIPLEPMGPGYGETNPIIIGDYNDDVLEESQEEKGVIYSCGLQDYIDTEKFSIVLLKYYTNVNVLQYNGGRYGVFEVQVETNKGTFDGIWDDSTGKWYENAEDYEE